jgi:hypothetical protein
MCAPSEIRTISNTHRFFFARALLRRTAELDLPEWDSPEFQFRGDSGEFHYIG